MIPSYLLMRGWGGRIREGHVWWHGGRGGCWAVHYHFGSGARGCIEGRVRRLGLVGVHGGGASVEGEWASERVVVKARETSVKLGERELAIRQSQGRGATLSAG